MSDELIPQVPPVPQGDAAPAPQPDPAPAPPHGVKVQAALATLASQPPSTWDVLFAIGKALPALIAQWKESAPVLKDQFDKFWLILGPIFAGLGTVRQLIADAFRDTTKAA